MSLPEAVRSSGKPLHAAALCVAATTFVLVSSPVAADVVMDLWISPAALHHKRLGMTDLDQRRSGLLNNGNCYCVPTSTMNLLTYMANHGYPGVTPGPANYADQSNWQTITDLLLDLGAAVNICPGGQDPNDPDCNRGIPNMPAGCSPGGVNQLPDGQCTNLTCSSTIDNNYNAILNFGWLGNAAGKLVWTARFLDPAAPPTNFDTLAELAVSGNIMNICYGFYNQVATDTFGTPVWRRNGGHCVTLNELFAQLDNRWIGVRDPAEDNADIFVQSPFVTRILDAVDETFLLTTQPAAGPFTTWAPVTLTRLFGPWSPAFRRQLDGYIAVRPATGSFLKFGMATSIALAPPIGGGGGGGGGAWAIPNLQFADFDLDENQIGWYAVVGAPIGTPGPGSLVHLTPFVAPGGSAMTTLAETSATRVVLGRRSELFLLDAATGLIERRSLLGASLGSTTIPGARALAYDDATDTVLVLVPPSSAAGGAIHVLARELVGSSHPIASTEASDDWSSPSLATCPASGMIWVASSSTAYGLVADPTDPDTLVDIERLEGFNGLTSVDCNDAGRVFIVDRGAVRVFDPTPRGFVPGDAGPLDGVDVGTRFRVARNRSNFDPALHESDQWFNIDADLIEQGGLSIPDCLGDLNGDRVVDGADLGILLNAWGGMGLPDLNFDGTVDGADLGILLNAWGPCRD